MAKKHSAVLVRAVQGVTVISLGVSVGLLLSGCVKKNRTGYDAIRDVGPTLDMVSLRLEEYGTISMASPLFLKAGETPLEFKLTKTADQFYNDARADVQASAASLEQDMTSAGVGAKIQANLYSTLGTLADLSVYSQQVAAANVQQSARESAARAGARAILTTMPSDASEGVRQDYIARSQRYLAENYPGPQGGAVFPGARDAKLPDLDSDVVHDANEKAKDIFNSEKFATLRSLMRGDPKLANRAAVNIAAGDVTSAGIFQILGNPAKYAEFSDKKIMTAVSMVAVSPGWRTKVGFAADVSLSVRYEYQPARTEYLVQQFNAIKDKDDPTSNLLKKVIVSAVDSPSAREAMQTPQENVALAAIERIRAQDQVKEIEGKLKKSTKDKEDNAKELTKLKDQETLLEAKQKDLKGEELEKIKQQLVEVRNEIKRITAEVEQNQQEITLLQARKLIAGLTLEVAKDTEALAELKAAADPEKEKITSAGKELEAAQEKLKKAINSGGTAVASATKKNTYNMTAFNGPLGGSNSTGTSPVYYQGNPLPLNMTLNAVPAAPLVAAVSPMTDAEIVDVTAGVRQQKAFALTLAAALEFAGVKGQGKTFLDWAKRFEKEVGTRSASVAISTYSHSGGVFGFQIGPRLRAVAGDNGGEKIDDYTLERQSFPVLVILGIDSADLQPRFSMVNGKLVAYEPVLKCVQTMRWIPVNEPSWRSHERLTERERLDWAIDLNQVNDKLPTGFNESMEKMENIDRASKFENKLKEALKSKSKLAINEENMQGAACLQRELYCLATHYWGVNDRDNANSARKAADTIQTVADQLRAAWSQGATEGINAPDYNYDVNSQKGILMPDNGTVPDSLLAYTKNRIELLNYQALGSFNQQYIPVDIFDKPKDTKIPDITGVPDNWNVPFGSAHTFVFRGKNLNAITSVTVGEKNTPLRVDVISDTVMLVTIQATQYDDLPVDTNKAYGFTFNYGDKKTIDKKIWLHVTEALPESKPVVAIKRDAQGRVLSFDINAKADPKIREQVMDLLEKAFKGDPSMGLELGSPGTLKLNVKTSTTQP